MALSLVRHLVFLDRHVRDGGWSYDATGVPRRPSDMTLAVIGMGRIGRRLAEMGHVVFGEVIGYDPLIAEESWPRCARRGLLAECLSEADVVSLHLPRNPETVRLIDRDALAAMRPGAYLVNVSRGGLIDSEALLAALDSGRLAGAALDVTDPEPPDPNDPIRRHPRILLTPHAAFYSASALSAYLIRQAENVLAWHRGGRPKTPVNGLRAGVA
jgi:D-3-phosphoglycerate dehydrogenase